MLRISSERLLSGSSFFAGWFFRWMVFSLHDLVELFAGFFRVDGILDRANCTKHLRAKIGIVGEWPFCHQSVVCGLLLRPAHGFNFSAVCVFWWYSENLWRETYRIPQIVTLHPVLASSFMVGRLCWLRVVLLPGCCRAPPTGSDFPPMRRVCGMCHRFSPGGLLF